MSTPRDGVRAATDRDLPLLARIEADGDALFEEWFVEPTGWEPPSTGEWRARQPGFLLVAVDDGEVVGFAHVLERAGWCHLEQLCVVRARQRRGHGRALVRTTAATAQGKGYEQLSLCTFADVPWNAPFYSRLGFTVVTPEDPFHISVRAEERRHGLERLGERVLMIGGISQILAS